MVCFISEYLMIISKSEIKVEINVYKYKHVQSNNFIMLKHFYFFKQKSRFCQNILLKFNFSSKQRFGQLLGKL